MWYLLLHLEHLLLHLLLGVPDFLDRLFESGLPGFHALCECFLTSFQSLFEGEDSRRADHAAGVVVYFDVSLC